jgi:hypothetical protein
LTRDKDERGVAVVVAVEVVVVFETEVVGKPEVVGATVCPAEHPACVSAPMTASDSLHARPAATNVRMPGQRGRNLTGRKALRSSLLNGEDHRRVGADSETFRTSVPIESVH